MKKIRLIALLICIALVLCVFTSCKPNTGEEDNNNPIQSDGENEPEKKTDTVKDMGGASFYFVGSVIPKNERDYTEDEKEMAEADPIIYTLEQQAMMDKALETERILNCKVIVAAHPTIGSSSYIALLESGEQQADLIYSWSTFIRELYIGGAIADLSEISAIDLKNEEKWGSEFNMQATQYKGAQYGIPLVCSKYYPFASYFNGVLLIKENVFNAFETDWTPSEMVEDKTWTFDNFRDILPTVSTTDGAGANVYALGINDSAKLYWAALYVNEGSRVIYDEDQGKYVYGLTQENAVEAFEWARSCMKMESIVLNRCNLSVFYDDRATFLLTNCYRVYGNIVYDTDEYSWIPFPYGPHSIYGVSSSSYSDSDADCVVGIFKKSTEEATQDVGIVFNYLFGPTEEYGIEGYDGFLRRNYFETDDDSSWNVYKYMSGHIHSPYTDEMGTMMENSLAMTAEATVFLDESVLSYLSSVEEEMNEQLDKSMND